MDQQLALSSGHQKPEVVVALDLELNQRDTGPKIIEIGISVGDVKKREILNTESFFVNPEEEITEYINKLTGITQYQVDQAPTIGGAYDQVKQYLSQWNYRKQAIEWGSGDSYALKAELKGIGRGFGEDWCFGYTSMNVKNLTQAVRESRGEKTQGGLAKTMRYFKIPFIGTKHQAADDAENTLRLYFKMLDLFRGLG